MKRDHYLQLAVADGSPPMDAVISFARLKGL